MESFSKDPRVICQIGRHFDTDEKLPESLLGQAHEHRIMLDACETFMQSKMAMLDQKLHNEEMVNLLARGYMKLILPRCIIWLKRN